MHPMELLDEVYHMESRFGPFGDNISFGARKVHSLCLKHPQSKKPFSTHLLVLLGEEAQVEARIVLFRDSANLNAR